jgi:putative transposase
MAAINQNIKEGLIFHSDRGGQYAAEIFINILYSYKKKTHSQSQPQSNGCAFLCLKFFLNP